MALFARVVYAALMRQERRRARNAAPAPARPSEPGAVPAHLETGRRGETLAYWYLRRMGYTVVARNLRSRPGAGELDMVAWEGQVLVFVEVKTRTSDAAGPPEMAVARGQQARIGRAAQIYMRRMKLNAVNYRYDLVSVAWDKADGYRLRLIKDAFKEF
jgi:putative endonuclease